MVNGLSGKVLGIKNKGGENMEHGPFKNKTNAKEYATRMRKKGFNATLYKAKGTTAGKQWKVSVTIK